MRELPSFSSGNRSTSRSHSGLEFLELSEEYKLLGHLERGRGWVGARSRWPRHSSTMGEATELSAWRVSGRFSPCLVGDLGLSENSGTLFGFLIFSDPTYYLRVLLFGSPKPKTLNLKPIGNPPPILRVPLGIPGPLRGSRGPRRGDPAPLGHWAER